MVAREAQSTMPRMVRWLLVLACLMPLGGCCREVAATKQDAERFNMYTQAEINGVRQDIDRFIRAQVIAAEYLPFDAQRFLDWRKREWWMLRDELAVAILYEWSDVEKLTMDVARYYGYNIRNFPHLQRDALRFFLHADEEWRNLVMDVCIYVEFQKRELYPLREDLHRFYAEAQWEWANMRLDLKGFLEWRDREYEPLKLSVKAWFGNNIEEWDKLQLDMYRFRLYTAVEGRQILVDFRDFIDYEHASVPRLEDDVTFFLQFKRREWDGLRDGAARFALFHTDWEAERFAGDTLRYWNYQVDAVGKLMIDVDHFFSFYEREVRPLDAEVKRWWRFNISRGSLALVDLKNFYVWKEEEASALEADMHRFFSYGGKEWIDLVAHVKRFSTCGRDPTYGSETTPEFIDISPPVMDDPVVRDWDINK